MKRFVDVRLVALVLLVGAAVVRAELSTGNFNIEEWIERLLGNSRSEAPGAKVRICFSYFIIS